MIDCQVTFTSNLIYLYIQMYRGGRYKVQPKFGRCTLFFRNLFIYHLSAIFETWSFLLTKFLLTNLKIFQI